MTRLLETLVTNGLLIATHNQGKLREIQELLAPLDISCMCAADKMLPEPEENGTTFIQNAMIKSLAAAQATNMPCLADDSGLVVPNLDGDPGIYSARWAGPDKNFDYAMKSVRIALEAKGKPLDSDAYFVCVLSLALPGTHSSPLGGEQVKLSAHGAQAEPWGVKNSEEATPHDSSATSGEVASHQLPPKGGVKYHISTTTEFSTRFINVEGRVYGTLSFPPRGDAGFGYDPIFVPNGMQQTFAEISSETKRSISHRANAFRGLMEIVGG